MLEKQFFENKFGTWWPKIEKFFDIQGFEPIYRRIKEDSAAGKLIAPSSKDTFKCFQRTELSDLKCVMMGLSPYHTMDRRKGIMVADGLLMSASVTQELPPSLVKFYGGLEEEYRDTVTSPFERDPDLNYLASQGVLMFNASLTTEVGKAGSHLDIWEPFTRFIFEEILAVSGVPIIFLGKEASKFSRYLGPMQWQFPLSHPAAASYREEDWHTNGTFKKVNKIIKDTNGYSIMWIKTGTPF